jgi:hypothetical protein
MAWSLLKTNELQRWMDHIPASEQEIYTRVLAHCKKRKLPFALGGAAALGIYTGHWRNTKDLDLYVLPSDRERAKKVMSEAGLSDYFDTCPYDRRWIYRASGGEALVDSIWAMANLRAEVDEDWIMSGPSANYDGLKVRFLPPEELIWSKLYVMQRERCDWPDIFNLLFVTGHDLDWDRLVRRLGDDVPLLRGVVDVFRWLCPCVALELPPELLSPNDVLQVHADQTCSDATRANLLDNRPWFGPRLMLAQ